MGMGIELVSLALTGLLMAGPIAVSQPDTPARAVEQEKAEREAARQAAARDREESRYEQGQRALDEARWQRAVEQFTSVADAKGARSDAALYWKAYALDKLGQKADALATAAQLMK